MTCYYTRSFPGWNGARRNFGKTLLAGNVAWLLPALVLAPQFLGGTASEANVVLLVAALANLHHFILDGAIWKLRRIPIANILIRDRSAREEGPEDASCRGVSRTLLWTTATLLLAIALAEFALRQIAIPERIRDGNPRAAVALLDRLAWIGRDSALLRLSLGHALARQGHSDAARDAYRRSALLTPSANAFSALAQLSLAGGDAEDALEQVQQALALAPGRPDVVLLAASIHQAAGNDELARSYRNQALRIQSGMAPTPPPATDEPKIRGP